MPIKSTYQKKREQKEILKAKMLRKEGLTLREIGSVVGKSHEWVRKNTEVLDKK
jgi:hypothetical protein